jgi:glycosyltransferase involved in cell wall biosynthesis
LIEAMACGLPVIAYRAGGALDTVTGGETGIFFTEPTQSALGSAIEQFGLVHWDGEKIAGSVLSKYGRKRFKDDMSRVLVSLDR